ncbi:ACP S-malonyltransferase [Paenibacillus aurantiacus]|uniref:[acyl-carrier-protein] S-malonyltransferase n=1 Tax=Paenibacillus aurantiacus TaxID=1936118 RepID=A0ABV5KMG5_9BACL
MSAAFLFPGQGSQYKGMFSAHRSRYRIVRQTFEEASDTLGYDLAAMCEQEPEAELARPSVAQPVLLTAGVAAYRAWTEKMEGAPIALAGHSLGEYTALACAGAIPFATALLLVRHRGLLMEEASADRQGGMLAVSGLDQSTIESLFSGRPEWGRDLALACCNSTRQFVLSGTTSLLRDAAWQLETVGARTIPLKVGAAFHSPLMAGAASKLEAALRVREREFKTPRLPVVSSVTGAPYAGGAEEIVNTLVRQMTEPVRWTKAIGCLKRCGVDVLIDSGPNRTLANLAKEDDPAIVSLAFDDPADHTRIAGSPRRSLPDADANRRVLEACLAAAVSTRNANDDRQAYAEGVVRPYRAIESMLLQAERSGEAPSDADARQALELLDAILLTKGIGERERKDRLRACQRRHNRKEGELWV